MVRVPVALADLLPTSITRDDGVASVLAAQRVAAAVRVRAVVPGVPGGEQVGEDHGLVVAVLVAAGAAAPHLDVALAVDVEHRLVATRRQVPAAELGAEVLRVLGERQVHDPQLPDGVTGVARRRRRGRRVRSPRGRADGHRFGVAREPGLAEQSSLAAAVVLDQAEPLLFADTLAHAAGRGVTPLGVGFRLVGLVHRHLRWLWCG